jgi:asparagine N-glycosylation enzyme membrane subunit Stt3
MSKRTTILTLVIICAVALAVRLLSMGSVFGGSFVSFIETDSYSRMFYAQAIASMPFWEGVAYTFSNNLLFSGLVAGLSLVMPLELAGAILPPILGVTTVVLVYLLATRLFNQPIGLISAAFVAIIPSEFLHRTLLGFADHHALEVLLLTLTLYLLVRAWQASSRAWVWTGAAGLTLVAYVVNWKSGLIMVGMLAAIAAVMALHALWRKSGHLRPATITMAAVGVSLAVYLPLGGYEYLLGLLPGASNLPVAAQTTQEVVGTVTSQASTRTISELRPMLFPYGPFSWQVVTSNLHLFAVTFLLGFVVLAREKDTPASTKVLVLGWSIFMLVAALMFRRNLYYFTINVAILSALAVWHLAQYLKGNRTALAAMLASPLILVSIPMASSMGQSPHYMMSEEWNAALQWLRGEQVSGHVTAWSDYGHWIKYVSGHEPNLLPGPGGTEVAQLLLSTDAEQARTLMDNLDTDYLIVDTPELMRKTGALAIVAGEQPPLDQTLMYRLWAQAAPQPNLTPVYQSETIRIYRYVGGG